MTPSETALSTYSTWQEGATAARAGKPISANPYDPIAYKYVVWVNGWVFATHLIAKENDEEL